MNQLVYKGKDKELKSEINELIDLISASHEKILYLLLPLDIDAQALNIIYQSGNKNKLYGYLEKFIPEFLKFHETYVKVHSELGNISKRSIKNKEKKVL